MNFRLRDFQAGDFEPLYRLDQECFPPGISYSRRDLTHYLRMRGAFTVVAESQSKPLEIAGFIVARRVAKGMGHVITLDTLAKFRRNGLGTLLMNAVEERFISSGCHAIILETAVDNAPAIAFYKCLGYFVLKTIPRYYQGRLDAFMMAKRIGEREV